MGVVPVVPVVSAGVLVAGVVEAVLDGWLVPASWALALGAGATAGGEEASGDTGVFAPSAPLARGPPRPAAVSPPPATAESNARHARLRALRGDMR